MFMADSNPRPISSHPISLLPILNCAKTLLINNTSDPSISSWFHQLIYLDASATMSKQSTAEFSHSLTGTVCILLLPPTTPPADSVNDSFLIWRCGKKARTFSLAIVSGPIWPWGGCAWIRPRTLIGTHQSPFFARQKARLLEGPRTRWSMDGLLLHLGSDFLMHQRFDAIVICHLTLTRFRSSQSSATTCIAREDGPSQSYPHPHGRRRFLDFQLYWDWDIRNEVLWCPWLIGPVLWICPLSFVAIVMTLPTLDHLPQ